MIRNPFAIGFFLGVLLGVLFSTARASSQELPPSVFLNKITKRLIGRAANPSEFESLRKELKSQNCTAAGCVEKFFRSYIREKMAQPEFYALAYSKVTERLGYKSPPSSALSRILEDARTIGGASEGRDFALIYRTFLENKSIDELFTSQIVTDPFFANISAGNTDTQRFTVDISNLGFSADSPKPFSIRLEDGKSIEANEFNLSGHPNIAGVFSSARFMLRYWDSPENQNKKRAAAYFRIMLCDMMSPALERESQKEKEVRIALGISDDEVIAGDLKQIHKNRHADQKDCAVCHTRLDPIGRTMRPLEIGISAEPFKGNLHYYNSMGEITNIPVNHLHDLIEKTTKQPKYLDCQVNWLIETYAGKDLNLPPLRFNEILSNVEKKNRRVKTVIEDILMIPELRGIVTTMNEPASLIASRKVLANCTECHSGFLKGRPEQIKGRLARAAVCLDLPNDGKERAMPPSSHYWEPTAVELGTLKGWIQGGAPLAEGQRLFDNDEVAKVLSKSAQVRKCRQ